MAFRGIPFDSKMVSDSSGTYEDRQVFSEDFARYLGFVSSDGICLKDDEELTSQLLVEAGTGSEVILNPGTIKIQGRMGWITEPESLFLNPGGSLPRIDSAVIELNLSTSVRGFVFKIVEGEESSNPEPPILVRTPDIWQLGLGNFYRVANSTSSGEFTDTRLDSERCGISKVATPNIGADTLTLWQESYPDITNLNDILHLIGSEGLPEEFGGTHSKSLPEARQNINYIGLNPITSGTADDTPAKWKVLGTGIAKIGTSGTIKDKPTPYGVIINNVVDGNVTQIWQGITSSGMWFRLGDDNGWNGTWRKVLDETNGVQMKKLWSNASPTSNFAAQNINIGNNDFNSVIVVCRYTNHNETEYESPEVFKNKKVFNAQLEGAYTGDTCEMTRSISFIDNLVKIEDCTYKSIRSASGGTVQNNFLIPDRIYGIKGVL